MQPLGVKQKVEVREDGVGAAGEADGEGVAAGGRHALTGIWKAASMVTDDDMLSSATATTTTTIWAIAEYLPLDLQRRRQGFTALGLLPV